MINFANFDFVTDIRESERTIPGPNMTLFKMLMLRLNTRIP
jgi:hypothetical protein